MDPLKLTALTLLIPFGWALSEAVAYPNPELELAGPRPACMLADAPEQPNTVRPAFVLSAPRARAGHNHARSLTADDRHALLVCRINIEPRDGD